MTANLIPEQLELDFSCETPICVEAVPTTTASEHKISLKDCTHPRLSLGLDRAHCPDCKAEFHPWSKEYKKALEPQPQVSEPNQPEWKLGDRVTLLSESPGSLWQILKVADGHATVERLDENTSTNRRRVALWKLRPCCALDYSGGRNEQLVSVPSNRPPEHRIASPHSTVLEDESPDNRPPELSENDVQKNSSPRDSRHTPASGWIEKYLVKRKWEYYRYCWQSGHKGKINKLHISGDSGKLTAVREAISKGRPPEEIASLLKNYSGGRDKGIKARSHL